MRRHAAPGAPWLGKHDHVFGGRAALELKRQARCLLQGEVARWPGVGVSQTEQEINVRGPRADPMQPCERGMGCIGFHVGKRSKINLAFGNRITEGLHGPDLGPRQSKPGKLGRACTPQRIGMKGIEGGREPCPDRGGARGRKLLGANNGAQPRESGGPPAQCRLPGSVDELCQPGIRLCQHAQRGSKIGIVMEDIGSHGRDGTRPDI